MPVSVQSLCQCRLLKLLTRQYQRRSWQAQMQQASAALDMTDLQRMLQYQQFVAGMDGSGTRTDTISDSTQTVLTSFTRTHANLTN
jgi:hypothetical protein